MYCPNCGEKIEDKQKFCTKCGYKLDNNSTSISLQIHNLLFQYKYIITILLIIIMVFVFIFKHISQRQNLYEVEDTKFINSQGKIIFQLPDEYNIIGKYSEGHILVGTKKEEVLSINSDNSQNGGVIAQMAVIDNKGKITKLPFDIFVYYNFHDGCFEVPPFKNGKALLIDKDGNYRLINSKGKEVKNSDIKTAIKSKLTISPIEDTKGNLQLGFRILDRNNNELYRTTKNSKYKYAYGEVSEGLLLVGDKFVDEENINFAYIDKFGKVKLELKDYSIPVTYHEDFSHDFHNGLALVNENRSGKPVYINKKGHVVISGNFTFADSFNDGTAWVQYCEMIEPQVVGTCDNGNYINTKGDIIYKIAETQDVTRRIDFNPNDYNRLKTIKIKQNDYTTEKYRPYNL